MHKEVLYTINANLGPRHRNSQMNIDCVYEKTSRALTILLRYVIFAIFGWTFHFFQIGWVINTSISLFVDCTCFVIHLINETETKFNESLKLNTVLAFLMMNVKKPVL